MTTAIAAACGDPADSRIPAIPDHTTNHGVFSEQNLTLVRQSPSSPWLARVTLGNPSPAPLSGRIALTVIDLGNNAAAPVVNASFDVPLHGNTPNTIDVPLPGLPTSVDGSALVDYRLDYDLAWTGGNARGSRSAWTALQRIGLVGLEPPHLSTDAPTALTLFVINPATRAPLANVPVTVTGPVRPIATQSDAAGRVVLPLEPAPETTADRNTITITATHGFVRDQHTLSLPVVRARKLLLTTDKPLYQPGQTVHIRTLALGGNDRTPIADESIVFEVVDPKGNLIDRQFTTTDAFGVAATTFTLARQVLLGDWRVRAILDDVSSEKTIAVDRYNLPKFKVEGSLDKPWYRPGDTLRVSGQARYFFGKAVARARITARALVQDVEFTQFAEVSTQSDDDGIYAFELQLPPHVVGVPLAGGRGLFRVDIEVADAADQTVTRTLAGTVAKGGLIVQVIPDGGRIAADIDNIIHVVTTDPTGAGLSARVQVSSDGTDVATVTTDAQGLGRFVLPANLPGRGSVLVNASAGNQSESTYFDLQAFRTETPLSLRPDKAIYRDGDTATLDIIVATPTNRIWLDAIHGGQTVFTTAIDIVDGVGRHQFDVDGTMAGDIVLSAYFIDDTGTMMRDQRFIYIEPDNGLKVTLAPRRETHGPGDVATVDVKVEDAGGQGVVASVGVQIVDEALFALSEVQPGLLKVFFTLMNEIMTPTITATCNGCDATTVIREGADVDASRAEVAFSALGSVQRPGHDFETWTATESALRMHLTYFEHAEKQRLIAATDGASVRYDTAANVGLALVRPQLGRDPWGGRWTATTASGAWPILVTSSGPDETPDTGDDLVFGIYTWEISARDQQFPNFGGADTAAGGGPPWATDDDSVAEDPAAGGGGDVRVRRNFPETLHVNPRLITGADGRASFEVPLADSITQWRMTGLASSRDGLVGSGVGSMLVFQDFFVDIDAPVALTRNDKVRVPVALYNYLDTAQTVTVTLADASWFDAVGETVRVLTLEPGQVVGTHFDIRATAVGTRPLLVTARGTTMNDAVERLVRVVPDGRELPFSTSNRFGVGEDGTSASDTVTETIVVPDDAIEGATQLEVQVFPGVMAQATEGMDSLLRMPCGCFEQTTSSAWPNVLVADYLQRSGKSNPAVEMQARTYITEGYQRLLTFECASGGFNWWEGDNPGNTVLTAVAVMMFTDTARVAFVDNAVITRAAAYLARTQKADGSWGEERHLHSGNENLGAGSVRSTAYTAWALLHARKEPAAAAKAIAWLRGKLGTAEAKDVYTAALMILALATNNPTDQALEPLLARLADGAIRAGDGVHWEPAAGTMVGGYGDSGAIETTAVAALALLTTRSHTHLAQGAVNWLLAMKDPNGNWGYSTQATVLTLKVLLAALGGDDSATAATVNVRLDGEIVATRNFNATNADVRWSVDLSDRVAPGTHVVTLEYEGQGHLSWQVSGATWVPFDPSHHETPSPLSIAVAYDRTTLGTDDIITVNVAVSNDGDRTGMMMAELGIPPGFELDTAPIDAMLGQGVVSNYERSALKLVVYLEPVQAGAPARFSYKLRALWPLEAAAPESSTWLYYDHATRATTGPVAVRVQ